MDKPRRAQRPPVPEPAKDGVRAWEMIEPGRFQPRRIKGSFPGRDLG